MPIKITAAGQSDAGREREQNEDWFYLRVVQSLQEELSGLFVVADGMGGHLAGEVASQLAVETLESEFSRSPRETRKLDARARQAWEQGGDMATLLADAPVYAAIQEAVQRANQVVRDYTQHFPDRARDAGSTVTMAVVKGWTAYIANVGDSRTYLLRDGILQQLTTDHSLVAGLVASGTIQPEDVYTHPQRNIIYRNLGSDSEVEVDITRQPLQSGDRLLLCSDGLWEMVRDPQITALLEGTPDVWEACDRLVQTANENGGHDNITTIVVEVGHPT
jgi:protein phosphatase